MVIMICCLYISLIPLLLLLGATTTPLDRLPILLERLEIMLSKVNNGSGYFVSPDAPSWADYFMFEALDLAITTFYNLFDEKRFPLLYNFVLRMRDRPNIKSYIASGKRCDRITGSPMEDEIRENLRKKYESQQNQQQKETTK